MKNSEKQNVSHMYVGTRCGNNPGAVASLYCMGNFQRKRKTAETDRCAHATDLQLRVGDLERGELLLPLLGRAASPLNPEVLCGMLD